MENKKTRAKDYYQAKLQDKLQKRSREKDHRNLSEDENLKREIMLTIEIKIWQMKIEKEKKYLKNDYNKRKKLLNHLINCLQELENINLNP